MVSAPQSGSAILGTLKPGVKIRIGDRPKNGFYSAMDSLGTTGWVPQSALIVLPHQAPRGDTRAKISKPSPGKRDASDANIYLSLLGGIGFAANGSDPTFGAEAGFKFSENWGMGLNFTFQSLSGAVAASNTTVALQARLFLLLAELDYYFVPALHLGLEAGGAMVAVSQGSSSAAANVTGGAGGGALGYDYHLGGGISLGAKASLLDLLGGSSGVVIDFLGVARIAF